MPTYEERRSPRRSVVYGRSREARQPGWLMPTAVAFGAIGVLVGVLLATGIFAGSDGGQTGADAGVGTLTNVTRSATATPQAPEATAPGPNRTSLPPAGTPVPEPTPTPAAASDSALEPISVEPELPPDVWVLRSASSSLCLDITPGGKAEGADVQQVECTADASQQWRMSRVLLNTVTLTNVDSGKCLEVDRLSQSNGAAVQQWTCNGGPNQVWRVTEAADGKRSLAAVHSGKCLAVPDSTPGVKVRQSSCKQNTNQQWTVR